MLLLSYKRCTLVLGPAICEAMFQIFGTVVPARRSLDIVVDTATRVGAGQSPIQIPVGITDFYVTQNV